MRRVAVLADVHGHLVALRAVLADLDALGVNEIVVAGDMVNFGPQSPEVVDLLRERGARLVRGNHEVELGTALGLDGEGLRAALADHRYLPRVQQQFAEARATGVDGVPTYVAGGYALVGAQPYETFHRLMAAAGQPPRTQP